MLMEDRIGIWSVYIIINLCRSRQLPAGLTDIQRANLMHIRDGIVKHWNNIIPTEMINTFQKYNTSLIARLSIEYPKKFLRRRKRALFSNFRHHSTCFLIKAGCRKFENRVLFFNRIVAFVSYLLQIVPPPRHALYELITRKLVQNYASHSTMIFPYTEHIIYKEFIDVKYAKVRNKRILHYDFFV